MAKKIRDLTPRFGIGEWYGNSIIQLSGNERQELAAECLKPKSARKKEPCPFQARNKDAVCNKDGGVCSLRSFAYEPHAQNGRATGVPVTGKQGDLRATCPYRFHEDLTVFKWVGQVILDDPSALLVGEVGFLEADPTTDTEGGEDVGRIDMVLVSTKPVKGAPMAWAALEIQAVYFSGNAMRGEFEAYADKTVDWPIFPAGRRRPDYRSSGPKRLMPQLQIKVPTLRRWGKKMAVVVDEAFFSALGAMDDVKEPSNADIGWFIVRLRENGKVATLEPAFVRFTTLERAVEG